MSANEIKYKKEVFTMENNKYSEEFKQSIVNLYNSWTRIRGLMSLLEAYGDLLMVEELCEALLIGENTAYEILNSGQLRAFREGSRWKIPQESVALYIKKRAGL